MADLWNDVEAALAPFAKLGRLAEIADRQRQAEATDSRTCGHCYWWMKSSKCPHERNVHGRNQGPSCGDRACDKFKLEEWAKNLAAERRAKVAADLEAEMA